MYDCADNLVFAPLGQVILKLQELQNDSKSLICFIIECFNLYWLYVGQVSVKMFAVATETEMTYCIFAMISLP